MEIIYDNWLYNPYCKICGLTYDNFHHPFEDKHDRIQPMLMSVNCTLNALPLPKIEINVNPSCWTKIYNFYINFLNNIRKKNE